MVRRLRGQLDAWAATTRSPASSLPRPASVRSPPAAISARFTISARPAGTTRRCNSGATNIRSTRRSRTIRKPYVALIDGLVMGGGVGVSVHGSHRVAGDRFQFAMPEVGIGFFPDVGATWFLPRMPGELGTYCALTGERFNGADACATGIATRRIPSARFAGAARWTDRHGLGRRTARRLRRTGRRGTGHAAARCDRSCCSPAIGSRISSPRSTAMRRPPAPMPPGRQKPPPPCGPNRRSA